MELSEGYMLRIRENLLIAKTRKEKKQASSIYDSTYA
jgi:hypothetical protein